MASDNKCRVTKLRPAPCVSHHWRADDRTRFAAKACVRRQLPQYCSRLTDSVANSCSARLSVGAVALQ